MIISIVNHSNGQVTDEELQFVVRAINRQIHEDFEPYWSLSATLRLEGRSVDQPDAEQVADLRGDAVIYLWDHADVPGALGYHYQNNRGIPYGFVFTDIAQQIGEPWSVTLSHEALELVGDCETNILVMGPHPTEDRMVFHWYEMCDAVQAETYEIDGIAVSNFLLPLYFTGTRDVDEVGARNDFLGRSYGAQTLQSFGINPGGYIGFFDPELGDHDTYSIKGDAIAEMRLAIKSQASFARRSIRYRTFEKRENIEERLEKRAPVLRKTAHKVTALAHGRVYASAGSAARTSVKSVVAGSLTNGRRSTAASKVAKRRPAAKAAAAK